jgi:hypothetical protein
MKVEALDESEIRIFVTENGRNNGGSLTAELAASSSTSNGLRSFTRDPFLHHHPHHVSVITEATDTTSVFTPGVERQGGRRGSFDSIRRGAWNFLFAFLSCLFIFCFSLANA